MKITVIAKPGARKREVLRVGDDEYRVSVPERAHDGKANEAIRECLAHYFRMAKSRVILIHGQSSRKKIFEIT